MDQRRFSANPCLWPLSALARSVAPDGLRAAPNSFSPCVKPQIWGDGCVQAGREQFGPGGGAGQRRQEAFWNTFLLNWLGVREYSVSLKIFISFEIFYHLEQTNQNPDAYVLFVTETFL